ncbi:hypothetical protein NOM01_16240 [Sporolactobacillus sp. STSJ-5]|uniref:hypothetical protein n=1 Tax=Sporolactobacillus sp. STSJ-5 TaxID=2965076 RepID=UPI0021040F10|nr:hypothetical protein [Sporolactobacillus sp. STSJ-5]MCQ2011531.1 hypothetical protein [Sporolactobacillus sp. STSJ-5]
MNKFMIISKKTKLMIFLKPRRKEKAVAVLAVTSLGGQKTIKERKNGTHSLYRETDTVFFCSTNKKVKFKVIMNSPNAKS